MTMIRATRTIAALSIAALLAGPAQAFVFFGTGAESPTAAGSNATCELSVNRIVGSSDATACYKGNPNPGKKHCTKISLKTVEPEKLAATLIGPDCSRVVKTGDFWRNS